MPEIFTERALAPLVQYGALSTVSSTFHYITYETFNGDYFTLPKKFATKHTFVNELNNTKELINMIKHMELALKVIIDILNEGIDLSKG